eukprot:1184891-Prorocentrum_minimum.AAC.2
MGPYVACAGIEDARQGNLCLPDVLLLPKAQVCGSNPYVPTVEKGFGPRDGEVCLALEKLPQASKGAIGRMSHSLQVLAYQHLQRSCLSEPPPLQRQTELIPGFNNHQNRRVSYANGFNVAFKTSTTATFRYNLSASFTPPGPDRLLNIRGNLAWVVDQALRVDYTYRASFPIGQTCNGEVKQQNWAYCSA